MSKLKWISNSANDRLINVPRTTTRRRYERWKRMYRKALSRFWMNVMGKTLEQGFIGASYGSTFLESTTPPGGWPEPKPEPLTGYLLWESKIQGGS